ncbi:MAG: hypothetical protein AAF501_06080 [Pseudomonadota bacterium]
MRYLRLWCHGTESRNQIEQDFRDALGRRHGSRAAATLNMMFDVVVRHGRRPLMRHDVACKCLGGDESALANMVGAAVAGEREDAALLAALLVRPDMAFALATSAEQAGLALQQMILRSVPPEMSAIMRAPPSNHVH